MKLKMILVLLMTVAFKQVVAIENINDQITMKSLAMPAGGWSSGGGNAVVCFNKIPVTITTVDGTTVVSSEEPVRLDSVLDGDGNIPDWAIKHIRSIEMFDLYEGKLPRGFEGIAPKVINIGSKESIESYIDKVEARFIHHVPSITKVLRQGRTNIPSANIRFSPTAVKQVHDIDNMTSIDTESCMVSTMAIQRNFNGHYGLYIDQRLFNHVKHSRLSKTALILHEYIYSVARANGEESSATTRELVGTLLTTHEEFSVGFFSSLSLELGFSELSNYNIELNFFFNTYLAEVAVNAYQSELNNMINMLKFEDFAWSIFLFEWNKEKNQQGETINLSLIPFLRRYGSLADQDHWSKHLLESYERGISSIKLSLLNRMPYVFKRIENRLMSVKASDSDRNILLSVLKKDFRIGVNSIGILTFTLDGDYTHSPYMEYLGVAPIWDVYRYLSLYWARGEFELLALDIII